MHWHIPLALTVAPPVQTQPVLDGFSFTLHIEATGIGDRDGLGVGVGDEDGLGVGVSEGDGLGVGVGDRDGLGIGIGVIVSLQPLTE